MKRFNKWVLLTRVYLCFSMVSLLSVSIMALFDPQSVMDLVGINLNNNDAISSIRGIYGGVGITICLTIFYLLIRHPEKGAGFLSVFWGAYAFSRLITLISDGPLGDFGNKWLVIETVMALVGLGLWLALNSGRRKQKFILNSGF